jgi:hypothetical protein
MLRKLLAVLAVLALSITGVALAAKTKPKAKKDSGTAWAGVNHQEGKTLVISGDIKDKLLGRGAIVYFTKVGGSTTPGTVHVVARKITIYTAKGSLAGSGSGDQVINTDGTVGGVKNGKFKLTKGTQKFKGHSIKGGTFTADYDNGSGVYTFHYKGTYR